MSESSEWSEWVEQCWVGVDLDGTLAHYDYYRGHTHIGPPIPAMVERVKRWLRQGKDVRLFTARADFDERLGHTEASDAMKAWCREHLGQEIPITNRKDGGCVEFWDDRAVQVVPNTGRTLSDEHKAEMNALRGKSIGMHPFVDANGAGE